MHFSTPYGGSIDNNDQIAFELGTDSTGGITKIHLKDGGGGYTSLPTISVTSNLGTSTVLTPTTNTIGAVDEVKVVDSGFDYSEAPALDFRANFVLKDVNLERRKRFRIIMSPNAAMNEGADA